MQKYEAYQYFLHSGMKITTKHDTLYCNTNKYTATFTQTHSEKPFCHLAADKANLLYFI